MEMEAGGPSSKKGKLADLEIHEEAAAMTTEAVDPNPRAEERSTDRQEPPPGADGSGGGADRISDLPDAVLGEIICLLPAKDGARTQVLASRWRRVWRSAPLLLTSTTVASPPRLCTPTWSVVSLILSAHPPGPGRRFCAATEPLLWTPGSGPPPSTTSRSLSSPASSSRRRHLLPSRCHHRKMPPHDHLEGSFWWKNNLRLLDSILVE